MLFCEESSLSLLRQALRTSRAKQGRFCGRVWHGHPLPPTFREMRKTWVHSRSGRDLEHRSALDLLNQEVPNRGSEEAARSVTDHSRQREGTIFESRKGM